MHVGFAADGFLMYDSKSGADSPSYSLSTDANGDDNLSLDECNGTEIDGSYASVITDEYPFISRCLNGEFTATGPGAGPPMTSSTQP